MNKKANKPIESWQPLLKTLEESFHKGISLVKFRAEVVSKIG